MASDLIKSVQDLIDSGRGDDGRNRFILSRLQQGKPLYRTDQQYIERLLTATIKRVKTPESIWMTEHKIAQEEQKKVELAELKTKVADLDEKLEEMAKKTVEPPPPKPVYKYSSGRTAGYLAIFYVGVVLVAIGTLVYKSTIFSILQIAEPENFAQYAIQVAIGIIIIYTVLVYSKVIVGLASKLIDDIKGMTVKSDSIEKPSSVDESGEKFF